MILLGLLASWNLVVGPLQQPEDTLRVSAVGDINLGRRVARERLQRGDTLYSFAPVVDSLRAADLLFGNLESPIAPDTLRVRSDPMLFAAPELAAEALARAGFDIVSTANNHAWDAGPVAVEHTMKQLTRAGVLFVGSGFGRDMAERPVLLERRGWRIAFFAVTRAWNPAPYSFFTHEGARYVAWGDPAWIYPAVRQLKDEGRADLIVVSVHGGREYVEAPPAYHRIFLEGLIDAGADIVLAHHPHVPQPIVWRKGKPIVQSLGNFVFAQDKPWTNLSAIVRIEVAPDRSMRASALPVRVGHRTRFATGAASDSVLRRLGLAPPPPAPPATAGRPVTP